MLVDQFKAARRAWTPLVAIRTPDPAATQATLAAVLNGEKPVIAWDIVRGVYAVNKPGAAAVSRLGGDPTTLTNPTEALSTFPNLPDGSVVFFHNLHRFLENTAVIQAVSNLRDVFKDGQRMLVGLGTSMTLPAELSNDMVVLDESLPGPDQLRTIVADLYSGTEVKDGFEGKSLGDGEWLLPKAVDTLSGLSAFAAEQATAMSMNQFGLDLDALWGRKREQIEQTPGLSVWKGGETFDGIGGVDNAKTFLRRVLDGRDSPRVILFEDEVEKSTPQVGALDGGVSGDSLGTKLSWMEDKNVAGMIAIGPPGCAKSMIAKAMGNTAGIPTIRLDAGAMRGSLVGQSEERLRNALKVVDAVGAGRVFAIATCNNIATLPPELRRRYTMGTWYFDLPTPVERLQIWALYGAKYQLDTKLGIPADDNWTGAEIKQCCSLAWRLKCSLLDAATYVVPVATAAASQIERLREEASGRYISASHPGLYERHKSTGRREVTFS